MLGWLIFKHAAVMLWNNRAVALRLALVPFLLAILAVMVFVSVFSDMSLMQNTLFPGSPVAEQTDIPSEQLGSFFTGLIGFMILSLVFTLWVIIAWHRYILLEEMPQGVTPPFHGDRMLAYFGQLVKLFLLAFGLSIPFSIIFVMAAQSPALLVLVGVIFGMFLIVVFYRLSIVLPAAAIGRSITLRQAWTDTEGSLFAIIVLVIVAGVAQMAVQFVGGLFGAIPGLGFAVNLLISFAIGMLNASILTTLYGHYVEGRDL